MSTNRVVVSTAVRGGPSGLDEAKRVAFSIENAWRCGEPPDLDGALGEHPELRRYRSVLLNLAYHEYRLRRQAGEPLDAKVFAARFPSLQNSLQVLIVVQDLLSCDPEFQAIQREVRWPKAGERFLQFHLLAEIGRGTFGRVFLACELALGNRPVVLKIAPHGGEEAEILGRLRHPGIVPVYSVQEEESTRLAAFCMPYLGRATLCDVIDRAFDQPRPPTQARVIFDAIRDVNEGDDRLESPLPDKVLSRGSYVNGVLRLASQLADALAHSHGRGICHRDLKPSNVLMTPDGRPLLLDFNLSVDHRLPVCKVGGTLPYMAPEELAAITDERPAAVRRPCDPRSDLFSLGVIVYELLTGDLPFGPGPWGRSVSETARNLRVRQADGFQRVRARNPAVEPRLARLIESCLAPNPEDRPETAAQLAAALRKELSPWRRSVRWARCHRPLVGSLTCVFLALVLVAGVLLATRPPYSVRQYRRGLAHAQRGEYKSAIGCYTNAIHADEEFHEALFARARAEQILEDFPAAMEDYQAACRIDPSPILNACTGYCLSRVHQHAQAIVFYLKALDAGGSSPVVLNNLAFSCLQLKRLDEAEGYLRGAIQADPNLQAAHHNLVLLLMLRAHRRQPLGSDPLVHVRRAFETGSPSAELYRDSAELCAFASQSDRSLAPQAIEYVAKAVESGIPPRLFASGSAYSALRSDEAFQRALAAPASKTYPAASHLLDPLDSAQ